MNFDALPMSLFFAGTILVVLGSIELGYWLGRRAHRSADEKESPVSGVSGAILGLTAFMLAFTFGIVAQRFDARKELVREDANAIRTTFLRADFMAEPDRSETKALIREYLDMRVSFTQEGSVGNESVADFVSESERIQGRLWELAVANAARDMNSDVAALYVESLNEVFDINALRKAVGLQARVPMVIWFALGSLIVLGMMSIGYHTGIAGSRRSKATVILALSFALVITVIAVLDRPTRYVLVTQQPLIDVQKAIGADR